MNGLEMAPLAEHPIPEAVLYFMQILQQHVSQLLLCSPWECGSQQAFYKGGWPILCCEETFRFHPFINNH